MFLQCWLVHWGYVGLHLQICLWGRGSVVQAGCDYVTDKQSLQAYKHHWRTKAATSFWTPLEGLKSRNRLPHIWLVQFLLLGSPRHYCWWWRSILAPPPNPPQLPRLRAEMKVRICNTLQHRMWLVRLCKDGIMYISMHIKVLCVSKLARIHIVKFYNTSVGLFIVSFHRMFTKLDSSYTCTKWRTASQRCKQQPIV